RVEPADAEAMALLDLANAAQIRAGGDPFIGPKLKGLFETAGFTPVNIETPTIGGGDEAPGERAKLSEEFAEIFESLDEALGAQTAPQLHAAAARLRALANQPGAHISYVPTLVTATKPPGVGAALR
ncbi:MAG: hypothetical protein ACKVPX_00255, partial [Myxococcaceae bacterium]